MGGGACGLIWGSCWWLCHRAGCMFIQEGSLCNGSLPSGTHISSSQTLMTNIPLSLAHVTQNPVQGADWGTRKPHAFPSELFPQCISI